MVIVRGVNVYPSAVEDILRSFGVAEFRVETSVKQALSEVSIQIEAGESDLADRVTMAFQNALGLRVPVTCVLPGSLPRFEGKARRWIRR
jgi:phenylacetate-CoA ligase